MCFGVRQHEVTVYELIIGHRRRHAPHSRQQINQSRAEHVVITGVDGIPELVVQGVQFSEMRVIHPELPLTHDSVDHRCPSSRTSVTLGSTPAPVSPSIACRDPPDPPEISPFILASSSSTSLVDAS